MAAAKSCKMLGPCHGAAFTMVELLVVVIILAILAALIFPVLARAKESGYRSVATSNAKQLGLAIQLYSGDYEDALPPYFSGYDLATNTYNDPQKYWPELVAARIAVVHGRGHLGQAIADDLPKVFFDPIKPFKSQLDEGSDAIGIVSGWGFSNVLARWLSTASTVATKTPRDPSALAEPAHTVLLTETKDWLTGGTYPGVALALGTSPISDGRSAKDSTDAPYARSLSGDGLNITVLLDGHVKPLPRSALANEAKWWGE